MASQPRETRRVNGKQHHNIFTDPLIITGPRNSRTKKPMVEVDSEDEEMDEDDQQSDAFEEEANTDADADGDVDMEDSTAPAPPKKRGVGRPKARVVPNEEDEDEGEEVDYDLDAEGEEEPEETTAFAGQEEEDDQGSGSASAASRGSTPDPAKLTKRQRGQLGDDFLQLPMEPQAKKHLTAEEHAMRRTEMARRRKNLSEKRNEEEKMDTINKLLKKQAPKRRGKAGTEVTEEEIPAEEEQGIPKPQPTFIRFVSNRNGSRVGVPEELLSTPAGRPFNNAHPQTLTQS